MAGTSNPLDETPVSVAEAQALFAGLETAPALVLAVSGGPDSTALLVLVARWRGSLERGPTLLAVTVDHGLRPESAREARAVKRLAAQLGARHRTLRWSGPKPATGLQEAARAVRYRLLAAAARSIGAGHVLTAHTLDDQAETVLIRAARGSGLPGLAAMARVTPLEEGMTLVRPLLGVPKARLVETLAGLGISFVDDPSNRDPRFTRARLRTLMPQLAAEGLDARRLAMLARRVRRAEAALEQAVDAAAVALACEAGPGDPIRLDLAPFLPLPEEIGLRLLGRAIARLGTEGPVELGKLEALHADILAAAAPTRRGTAAARLRRTLAGALVTLGRDSLTVEAAPPRRRARQALTTPQSGRDRPKKMR